MNRKRFYAVCLTLIMLISLPDCFAETGTPDISILLHSAYYVHTGIEQFPEAPETLKASADDGVLFQHGNLQPLLGEDGTGE